MERASLITRTRGPAERLHEALSRPDVYPHHPIRVEVRETHISWVFLVGDLAYKLKKPLVLDFLDYGTPQTRLRMCEEEVRLNRRLAPDLYLGVRGVALIDGRVSLTDPGDPRAIDFVVEMRRYDEGETLASKLARGELSSEDVKAVAEALANFHATAERASPTGSPVLTVERRFERNVHELLHRVDQRTEVERVLALERFAHACILRHAHTFGARAADGRVRQGHGDLRAEHVLVNRAGEVRIVDCVEFDRELRELDVADDLSFLVFDLAASGGARFTKVLIEAYRRAGGDPGADWLVAFYAAYRALVRAKVALVRAAQHASTSPAHGHESALARDLIMVAERFAWQARLPLAIVVCGVPASGKSHLSRALAEASGLPHLSSDLTRKRLAGLSPTQRAPADRYDSEWNARTYAELGRLSAEAVSRVGGAIIDATFRHAEDRRSFRSTFGGSKPVMFVECKAPAAVLLARASRRERGPEHASDAGVEVVLREQRSWEPLDELPPSAHLLIRTDRAVDETLADVLALLDRRLVDAA